MSTSRRSLFGFVFALAGCQGTSGQNEKSAQAFIGFAQAIANGAAVLAPSFALIAGVPPDKIAIVQEAASVIQVSAAALSETMTQSQAQPLVQRIQAAVTTLVQTATPFVKDPKTTAILTDIQIVLPLLVQAAGLFMAAGAKQASPQARYDALARLQALRPRH